MPVSPAFAESNRAQTERLRKLVGRLDAAVLAVRLPNGWTVARADREFLCRRLAVCRPDGGEPGA